LAYKNFTNFYKRIIEPALKEIHERSNLKIGYLDSKKDRIYCDFETEKNSKKIKKLHIYVNLLSKDEELKLLAKLNKKVNTDYASKAKGFKIYARKTKLIGLEEFEKERLKLRKEEI